MMDALPTSPFVGLRPFRRDEALLFFGRRQQTTELLERLSGTHFLAVVGSSGCGKSSLIGAGLIPRLTAGFLVEDRDQWLFTTMTPGESPLARLAVEFRTTETALRESGAEPIVEWLSAQPEASARNCLLLVDQFEELFRFASSGRKRDEAADFVSILLALAEQREFPVFVVLTMRSDFLGDCDAFYALPEALNRSHYLVPRLTRQQRRETIEGPVRLFGATITPQLVDRVLNDLGDAPDQLPVMEHALLRTWEYWARGGSVGAIDLPHYLAIGGVKEALSLDADSALAALPPEDSLLIAQMFQALTDTDASNRRVRRPVRMSELSEITGASRERLTPIVNQFRESGRSFLIVQQIPGSDDVLIDICHESLIRQWKMLRTWAAEEAESKRVYLDLVNAVERKKALFRDSDLQVALDWRARTKPTEAWARRYSPNYTAAMAFLEESQADSLRNERYRARQERIRHRLTAALLAVSVLGAVLVAIGFYQVRVAKDQTNIAIAREQQASAVKIADDQEHAKEERERAQAAAQTVIDATTKKALALAREATVASQKAAENQRAEASVLLWSKAAEEFSGRPDHIDVSGALALEALRRADATTEPSARKALFEVLQLLPPRPLRLPRKHNRDVVTMVADPAGKVLVTGDPVGAVFRWDVAQQTAMPIFTQSPPIRSQTLAISADGKWVAAASPVGVRLWDGETEKQVWALPPQQSVKMLAFSPDRSRLTVVLLSDAPIQGTRTLPYRQLRTSDWQDFSPDTQRPAREAAYSPKGDLAIITEEMDPQNRLQGAILMPGAQKPLNTTYGCHSLHYDSSGNLLASCPSREAVPGSIPRPAGVVRIPFNFNANTRETRMTNAELRDFSLSSLRQHLVLGIPNVASFNLVRAFDLSVASTEFLRIPEPVTAFAVPANGDWVATARRSGDIAIWKIDRGLVPPALPFHGNVADLTFSHNETWLAVAEQEGPVHIFDTASGRPLKTIDLKSPLVRPLFSPDDSLLAVLGNNQLHLIQTADWRILDQLKSEKFNGVSSFSFGPDSSLLLLASFGEVRRYHTRPCCTVLPAIAGSQINQLSISPDRRWVKGVSKTTPQYWDVASGSLLRADQVAEHRLADPKQKWFGMWPEYDQEMTGDSHGGDGQSRDWTFDGNVVTQTETGSRIADLASGTGNWWAVSRKGNWIAVTPPAANLILWPWNVNHLGDRACQLLPRNLTPEEWKRLGLERVGLGAPKASCQTLPFPPDAGSVITQ